MRRGSAKSSARTARGETATPPKCLEDSRCRGHGRRGRQRLPKLRDPGEGSNRPAAEAREGRGPTAFEAAEPRLPRRRSRGRRLRCRRRPDLKAGSRGELGAGLVRCWRRGAVSWRAAVGAFHRCRVRFLGTPRTVGARIARHSRNSAARANPAAPGPVSVSGGAGQSATNCGGDDRQVASRGKHIDIPA